MFNGCLNGYMGKYQQIFLALDLKESLELTMAYLIEPEMVVVLLKNKTNNRPLVLICSRVDCDNLGPTGQERTKRRLN